MNSFGTTGIQLSGIDIPPDRAVGKVCGVVPSQVQVCHDEADVGAFISISGTAVNLFDS